MDIYSMNGKRFAQVLLPGPTPVRASPPGTATTAQAPSPISATHALPGIAPFPYASPAPAAYYGMHPPPPLSYEYLPSSADKCNASYIVPEGELRHYLPSFVPYQYCCGNGLFYGEPSPYLHGGTGPPQAYRPLPSRGSDLTLSRKKRRFLPGENHLQKSKPLRKSFDSPGKNFQQFEGVSDADQRTLTVQFNSSPMANYNPNVFYPFRQNRAGEVFEKDSGKKRLIEEGGVGKLDTNNDRGKGDRNADSSCKTGKRTKGRKPGVIGNDPTLTVDDRTIGSAETGENRKCKESYMTEEQVQEAAPCLELICRDVRRRIEEFLHTSSESEGPLKLEKQDEALHTLADVPDGVSNAETQGQLEAVEIYADAFVVKDPDAALSADLEDTSGQQIAIMDVMQTDNEDLLQSTAHNDGMQFDSLQSDAVKSGIKSIKQFKNVKDFKPDPREVAPKMVAEFLPKDSGTEGTSSVDQVIQVVNGARKSRIHQKPTTLDEFKDREDKSFDFFTKLLDENTALRKLYVENCYDGTFECLMCNSNVKKRFSNLVSLLAHANHVLKTKKVPEHRGYGRAVCSLFGWDPFKIPKVPIRNRVLKSVSQMVNPSMDAAIHI